MYTGRAMCSTACKREKSSGNRRVVVRVRVSVWSVDLDVLSGATIPHIILLPHIIFFVTYNLGNNLVMCMWGSHVFCDSFRWLVDKW